MNFSNSLSPKEKMILLPLSFLMKINHVWRFNTKNRSDTTLDQSLNPK